MSILLTGVGGGSYDPSAQAYFNTLSPQPSVGYKNAVNTLVLALKASGDWDKLDVLWIMAAEFQQNARISLVNPTRAALQEFNAPVWTANQGYTGNPATACYLDTNYNPSTQGINFTQNSASIFIYSRTNAQGVYVDIGCSSGAVNVQSDVRESGNYYAGINDGTLTGSIASATSLGFFQMNRTSNSNIDLLWKGLLQGSVNQAAVSIPNAKLNLMSRSDSGVASHFSPRQLAIAGAGAGSINGAAFYAAIQAFATTRGFNV